MPDKPRSLPNESVDARRTGPRTPSADPALRGVLDNMVVLLAPPQYVDFDG